MKKLLSIFLGLLLLPSISFGATLTVYPQAGGGGGNTTTDGELDRTIASPGETWSTITTSAGTGADTSADPILAFYWAEAGLGNNNKWLGLHRTLYTFDTSALGSNAVISAATLGLTGTLKENADGNATALDIYEATPTSNNNLVTGDYLQISTTSVTTGKITYANFNDAGLNTWTLSSSTGWGYINKTGVTAFGTREANFDAAGVTPTWTSGSHADMQVHSADAAATSTKPVLTITYTTSSPAVARHKSPMIITPN